MKNTLTDADKGNFADAIAGMLEFQKDAAHGIFPETASMDDNDGNPKPKALGYIYGYVDASLRSRGLNMSDMSVGPPITYQVIRKLWPDRVTAYMDFLIKNHSTDPMTILGVMHGGQQFQYSENAKGHVYAD